MQAVNDAAFRIEVRFDDRVSSVETRRYLFQSFAQPVALALKNTKASKYKVLLARVLHSAGFIGIKKVHSVSQKSQSGKGLAFTIQLKSDLPTDISTVPDFAAKLQSDFRLFGPVPSCSAAGRPSAAQSHGPR
jgi:hypothetical protein